MKPKNQKTKAKIRYGILAFSAVLLFLALLRGLSIKAVDGLSVGRVVMLNDQWELTADAGMDGVEYSFRILESAGTAQMLCMKTYLPEFQVLLDGETIYSFSDIYAMQGRSQHIIRIPQNSEGKLLVIRIEQSGDARSTGKSQIGNAYLGAEREVALKLLWDNLHALIFAVFALLVGMGTGIAGFWMRKSISADMLHCVISFGLFVLITGIWVLTDSELLLFVTNRVAAVSLLSFFSFMIMPVFLLDFINDILGGNRAIDVLHWLFVAVAAAYLINYLLQLLPGYLLLLPTHMLCVCSVIIVTAAGRKKVKSRNNKTVQWIMMGVGLLSIFVFFALICFYINPVSQYSNLYCCGIFVFILCLARAMMLGLYGQMEEKVNMAAYKRLAYMDAMTGMQNRAAFIEAQRQAESVSGLACIMLDINNLKWINDQCGHQEGDHAIIAAAHVIRDTFEEIGTCFRIGGDEFVVFLRDQPMEQIHAALYKMQKRISMENQGQRFRLDIAAGYAARRDDEPVSEMVRRADAGMYREKQRMKAEKDT